MNDDLANVRERLTELNRLEDEAALARQSGRSTLASEALLESLRANIPLLVLLHHDRLRAHGRRSFAEVQHGVCSGCHMALPISTQAEVKHPTDLLKCQNCGRFIFLAEEELEAALPRVTTGSGPAARLSTERQSKAP